MLTGLKHWFTRFLRRHRRLRHFGRHALLESIAKRGPARAAAVALAGELLRAAQGEPANRPPRSRCGGRTPTG